MTRSTSLRDMDKFVPNKDRRIHVSAIVPFHRSSSDGYHPQPFFLHARSSRRLLSCPRAPTRVLRIYLDSLPIQVLGTIPGPWQSRHHSGGKRNVRISFSDRRRASTVVRWALCSGLQGPARQHDASKKQGWTCSGARRLTFPLLLVHRTVHLFLSHVTLPCLPLSQPKWTMRLVPGYIRRCPRLRPTRVSFTRHLQPRSETRSFASTSVPIGTVTVVVGPDVEGMDRRMRTKPVLRRVSTTRCSHVGCSQTHVACAPGDGWDPRIWPWNPKASWKKQEHPRCRLNPVLGRQILEGAGLWRSSAE